MYLRYTAPTNHHFYNYLINQRGITPKEIEEFEIGFALDFLQEREKLRNYQGNQAIEFRKDKKGQLVPIFSNRIMFPVFNMDNKIIAWSGRSLDPSQPKYFNSSESRVFNKSQSFFGLNVFLKRKNREKIIIVEGQIDAIKANRYAPSLAPMGKFTKEHAQVLRRLGIKEALIIGDNDKAGRGFTRQAIKYCLEVDILPKIGKLKEFNDFGETNNQDFSDIVEVQSIYEYLKKLIDFIQKKKKFQYLDEYYDFINSFSTLSFLSIQEAKKLYLLGQETTEGLQQSIVKKYNDIVIHTIEYNTENLTNIEKITLDRLGFTVHRLIPVIYEEENIVRYYNPTTKKEIDLPKAEKDRLKKIADFLSPTAV